MATQSEENERVVHSSERCYDARANQGEEQKSINAVFDL